MWLRNMNQKSIMVLALISASLASQAEARRKQREGFNFGSSVRMIDQADGETAAEGTSTSRKSESNSQMVTPYVGYAFSSFNLGLSLVAEQKRSETMVKDEAEASESLRKLSRNTRGASLFMRFLFGQVFYFEAAGGYYAERLSLTDEQRQIDGDGGSFSGQSDAVTLTSVGPGYHLAAGLELPMTGGFYFTSAYQYRSINLRNHLGGMNVGSQRSQSDKSEILFGIAYYH